MAISQALRGNEELAELISGHFALFGLRLFQFCNSLGNTIVYHQTSGMHVSVLAGSPGLPVSLRCAFAGCHGLSE